MNRLNSKFFFIIAGVVIITALVAPSVYFFLQYRKAQAQLNNPQALAKSEIQKVVDQISKLMVLPVGEEPTVATVNDKEKLRDQPFFANAQNGDKVLIYQKARKAILYSVAMNKILEIGPVNIAPSASPSAGSARTFEAVAGANTISTTPILSPSPTIGSDKN